MRGQSAGSRAAASAVVYRPFFFHECLAAAVVRSRRTFFSPSFVSIRVKSVSATGVDYLDKQIPNSNIFAPASLALLFVSAPTVAPCHGNDAHAASAYGPQVGFSSLLSRYICSFYFAFVRGLETGSFRSRRGKEKGVAIKSNSGEYFPAEPLGEVPLRVFPSRKSNVCFHTIEKYNIMYSLLCRYAPSGKVASEQFYQPSLSVRAFFLRVFKGVQQETAYTSGNVDGGGHQDYGDF